MDSLEIQIYKTAINAVEKFQDRAVEKLDYSQSSLEAIEAMLTEASEFVDKMDKYQIDDLVKTFGCYVFEVARQEFGGQFFWHAKYNQPVIVIGEPKCHIAMITFNKVLGRLSRDEGDNIPFFYAGFADAARKAKVGANIFFV